MLIVEKQAKSPVAEAYKALRTNIQYSCFDREVKTILVTSSGAEEGKSTTASNLAFTFSQENKKVLLVDSDLRKPTIHKKFSISNERGLTEYLINEASFEEVIQKYNENLYIITSGQKPPNPSEMISSDKMKDFLKFKRDDFDIIIIDSPPVLPVTDSQILSTLVDGVLLVISSGETSKEACIYVKKQLQIVKANILGVVISKVSKNKGKGYNYYKYNYYYEEANNSKGKRFKKRKERKSEEKISITGTSR